MLVITSSDAQRPLPAAPNGPNRPSSDFKETTARSAGPTETGHPASSADCDEAARSLKISRWRPARLIGSLSPIPLKNSLAAWRLIFVDLNLQGSDLTRSRRERATRLVGEIFGVCRDPFVSMMRNVLQRASKISRLA